MKKPVLLVDFDETIFPFSSTYLAWVRKHYPGTKHVTSKILSRELVRLPIHVSNIHSKLQIETFVNSSSTVEILPRKDATEGLTELASKYDIICCTSRRNMHGTTRWVEKHYSHIIKEIEHVEDSLKGRNKIYAPFLTKRTVAKKTQATALIDDFAFNLWRLPPTCRGFVVKRDFPIPSDLGAISWADIVKCLI
jgi:hypothetical protein